MTSATTQVEGFLRAVFHIRHVAALLAHHDAMVREFQVGAWEEAINKAAKLVEAASKALYVHIGKTLPPARKFKVAVVIQELGQLQAGPFDDTVRITIPRALQFVYDIASNRGARHDPSEINPNEMDARAVLPVSSWIVAEMVRYSQKGALNPAAVKDLVDALTEKQYPIIEDVDGRTYFHLKGVSAREIAVLALWRIYPRRMTRNDLINAVARHPEISRDNAAMGVSRLAGVVDVANDGQLRLLRPGIQEAEQLMAAGPRKRRRRRRKQRRTRKTPGVVPGAPE